MGLGGGGAGLVVLEFADGPADDVAEGDDSDAITVGIDDWEAGDSVVEHDPGGGSEGCVWPNGDELARHDLVGASLEGCGVGGSFCEFADEGGEVFEQVAV